MSCDPVSILRTAVLTALLMPSAFPSRAATGDIGAEAVSARFDADARETRVTGHLTQSLCVSLALPQEWRMSAGPSGASLKEASGDSELEFSIRSARDLQEGSSRDLPGRDAAYLQRGYENSLGIPAQAVSLAPLPSGASRWTATWIDSNLPTPTHSLTVETFIVPLSQDWVLELSLDHAAAREVYDAIMEQVLASVRVEARCGR